MLHGFVKTFHREESWMSQKHLARTDLEGNGTLCRLTRNEFDRGNLYIVWILYYYFFQIGYDNLVKINILTVKVC